EGRNSREPVLAQEVAHWRARTNPAEDLVLFLRQHQNLLLGLAKMRVNASCYGAGMREITALSCFYGQHSSPTGSAVGPLVKAQGVAKRVEELNVGADFVGFDSRPEIGIVLLGQFGVEGTHAGRLDVDDSPRCAIAMMFGKMEDQVAARY